MTLIHPPLTAFPFALLLAVFVGEILNLYRPSAILSGANKLNLSFAAIGAILAFGSGYWEADKVLDASNLEREVVANHFNVARLFLLVIFPCVALKFIAETAKYNSKGFIFAYRVLLCISVGLASYTGFLGSRLVFEHGAGVVADQKR